MKIRIDIASWIAKKEKEFDGIKFKQVWQDKTLREATLRRILKNMVEKTNKKEFFVILLEDHEQQVYMLENTKQGFPEVLQIMDEAELSNLFSRGCLIYALGDNKAHAHFMSFKGRQREQAMLTIDYIYDDNVKITGADVMLEDLWTE